jgi:hypothetical protein
MAHVFLLYFWRFFGLFGYFLTKAYLDRRPHRPRQIQNNYYCHLTNFLMQARFLRNFQKKRKTRQIVANILPKITFMLFDEFFDARAIF